MRHLNASLVLAGAVALGVAGCGDSETPAVVDGFIVNESSCLSTEAGVCRIDAGSTVTLEWSVTDADTAVTIVAEPGGELLSDGAATGSVETGPIDLDTTFTLSVAGTDGVEQTATAQVQVTGISIIRFEANPASIGRGDTATLEWALGGSPPSEVVVLRLDDQGDIVGPVEDPNTDRNGSVRVTPEVTTTYRLRAQAAGSQDEADTTVTVESMPPTIVRFEAVKSINGQTTPVTVVALGERLNLQWETENATEVRISLDDTVIRDWSDRQVPQGLFRSPPVTEASVELLFEARNGPTPADEIGRASGRGRVCHRV